MLSAGAGFGKHVAENPAVQQGPPRPPALDPAGGHAPILRREVTHERAGLASFLARPHSRIVVDLGCGDARATARLAASDPQALVIGIDANLDAATRVIRRVRRAPEKGGLRNLALVMAAADDLPPALEGHVDELRIDLPWGSLLEGLLAGDPGLWRGLERVLAPGGRVRTSLNARSMPAGVPPDEAAGRLERAFASIGLEAIHATVTAVEPETGWAKRLAGGRPLPVIIGEASKPASR